MKKQLTTIVAVVALVIAVIAQFRISALQDEIRQLRNDLNNNLSMMRSDHSAAISYMEELMAKEASILTDTQFSLGALNIADRTFMLSGSVTPKEHQPGVTEAFLTVNGKAYPMQLANGVYTIQLDLPLFEEARVDKVEFHEGDVIRTETLDKQWSPRYELLPQINGRLSGSGRGSAANGVYTWHREGEIRVSVEGKGQTIDVRSVAILEVLDGVEVDRTEIPLTSTKSNRNEEPAPEPVPESGFTVRGSETFYHEIDRDFNIPYGSTLELAVEVVDGNGLRYRTVLEHWSVNEKGENVDDDLMGLRDLFEKILDADGNILYEVDEADYR